MKTEPPIPRTTMSEFVWQVYKLNSFTLFVAYLIMIYLSRFWTRFTRPWDVRKVMVVYNFCVSGFSAYTCLRFTHHCLTADHLFSRKYDADLIYSFYLYWLAKIIELVDTVFMILRHRGRQISFLHVFHHSTMLILSEYGYRITPRLSIALYLGTNSFIHILLYFYYGLCALNPNNPPNWKKLMTKLQIAQFLILLLFGIYGHIYHTFCVYGIFYGLSMLILFSKFYYQAYVRVKPKKA